MRRGEAEPVVDPVQSRVGLDPGGIRQHREEGQDRRDAHHLEHAADERQHHDGVEPLAFSRVEKQEELPHHIKHRILVTLSRFGGRLGHFPNIARAGAPGARLRWVRRGNSAPRPGSGITASPGSSGRPRAGARGGRAGPRTAARCRRSGRLGRPSR